MRLDLSIYYNIRYIYKNTYTWLENELYKFINKLKICQIIICNVLIVYTVNFVVKIIYNF